MAYKTTLWLAYSAIAFFPVTNAWTLVWRNDTGASIEHQETPVNCTPIYHEEGKQFSWDPEGAWCMNFWSESTCENRIGYSCDGVVWKKAASRDLSAFDVYPMPIESRQVYGFPSTSAVPTPTASTLTVTQPAETSATQTSEADTDSGNSLSGGAIAGIVVGAVAGLALLAALFFFLGKRKPKNDASDIPSSQPPPAPAAGASISRTGTNASYPTPQTAPTQPAAFPIEHKSPMAETPVAQSIYSSVPPYSPPATVYQPPSATRVVELPGNYNQLSEMDGSSTAKGPLN
ncbi:hypothetical protein BDV59DRAFT_200529 [Aspergillus ambiguus]|uniref:uncharacterized protein n=1 Tax=Aspergillus ambiguus TaxID=176160 RepID=UPI003CCD8F3C